MKCDLDFRILPLGCWGEENRTSMCKFNPGKSASSCFDAAVLLAVFSSVCWLFCFKWDESERQFWVTCEEAKDYWCSFSFFFFSLIRGQTAFALWLHMSYCFCFHVKWKSLHVVAFVAKSEWLKEKVTTEVHEKSPQSSICKYVFKVFLKLKAKPNDQLILMAWIFFLSYWDDTKAFLALYSPISPSK